MTSNPPTKFLVMAVTIFGVSMPLWIAMVLILVGSGITAGAVWILFPFILTLAVFLSSVFVLSGLREQGKIKESQETGYVIIFTVLGGILAYRDFVSDTLRGFALPVVSGQSLASYPRIDMQYAIVALVIIVFAYMLAVAKDKKIAPVAAIGLVISALFAFFVFGVGSAAGCYNGAQICDDAEKATTFDIVFKGYVVKAFQGITLEVEQPEVTAQNIIKEEDIEITIKLWDENYETETTWGIGDLGYFDLSKSFKRTLEVFGDPDGHEREYNYRITAVTKDGDKDERTGLVVVQG